MPILFGILFLAILYGLSVFFQLRLTQTIFNALFGIFVIILVIVFQKELRRFFGLIGVIGFQRKNFFPQEAVLQILVKTINQLAEHRTGALFVFPGNENLERHLEGGFLLGGKISKSLILSLFDTSSPGHDGAVIIEGDEVKRFAVHLPLAESIEAARKYGTRHRAALGLSEKTDALVVVVSEEKGTITFVHNRKMIMVNDADELEKKLREFFNKKFPQARIHSYTKSLLRHTPIATLSLAIAFSLWLFISYNISEIQRKFAAPIQFKNLSADFVADNYNPEDIVIVLSGRESDFKSLDPQNLKASIDLSKTATGWHTVLVKKENINHPSALSIVNIEPEIIKVHIIKKVVEEFERQ
ncbi:MAG: DNA integrity scanning protein DisA nucleotide-binding domain protein [Candidatus Portnoybacteria bacterium]|nr:DNA integrity scanning protein DisA nucleotide-binding domain protein [Candidatus Portnoybacteria bacterium]